MTDPDETPAPSRTDLAEDRTILANERTFAGWMRTSLASLAIGVGFYRLFPRMEPDWLPRTISTGFLLMAVAIIVMAERRAASVLTRLSSHVVVTARTMNLRFLTAVVSVAAIVLVAAIWTL